MSSKDGKLGMSSGFSPSFSRGKNSRKSSALFSTASDRFLKTFTHLKFRLFSKATKIELTLSGPEDKSERSSAEMWLFLEGLIVWFMAGKKGPEEFLISSKNFQLDACEKWSEFFWHRL